MRFLLVFLLMAGTGLAQSFTGFIDGYYGYNFNKPASRKNLYRNFDFNHNQFSLNYAELAVEQKPSPIGFRADIGFGDAAKAVHAAEPAGPDVYQYLQQIYLSAAHKKVQVDFGKFVTPFGAEVIETKDNWNYSRSALFALAIPYYHFGVRTTITAHEKLTFAGFLVNGWNNVVDNNAGKTAGIQVVAKPLGNLTLTQTYMAGNELADGNAARHLVDSIATLQVNSKLSLMANYDYGMDRNGIDRVRWQGVALYARVTPVSDLRLSPRLEWFDDPQGFITGTPQTIKEGTLTADFVFNENMFLRGEYRRDWSDEAVFQHLRTGTRSFQNTLILGVVYTYSKTK
ncbi:MAG: porin [Acidobacteria bacterium]|nr:porin [Acidobacteriota bacterium]